MTGLDVVKLQLQIAAGGRLEGDPPGRFGHAIGAHLSAEDPPHGFVPAPGRLVHLRLPSGPGCPGGHRRGRGRPHRPPSWTRRSRKLIAWGRDRDEALARLRRALADTVAMLDDGTTNQGFLLELLDHPAMRAG